MASDPRVAKMLILDSLQEALKSEPNIEPPYFLLSFTDPRYDAGESAIYTVKLKTVDELFDRMKLSELPIIISYYDGDDVRELYYEWPDSGWTICSALLEIETFLDENGWETEAIRTIDHYGTKEEVRQVVRERLNDEFYLGPLNLRYEYEPVVRRESEC